MVSGNRQSTVVAKLLPRVRGIRGIPSMPSRIPGTTSAYAENTWWEVSMPSMVWNYLRVRGEYLVWHPGAWPVWELPPRTRRIPGGRSRCPRWFGTTSAYAENTPARQYSHGPTGNYLRVRGEYWDYQGDCEPQAELPPRTRRILGLSG